LRCVAGLARGPRSGRSRMNTELEVIRLESFPPRVLARVVRYRHFVRKEIEIKRLIFSRGTELLGLGAGLSGAQHAGWQTSEPARLCGRDCKLGVRRSRPWRLADRHG